MAGHARASNVLIEQFQFETLRVPNHTACRFAEKRGFSAHFWPGGAVPPPRGSPFSKVSRSGPHQPPLPASLAGRGGGISSKNHFFQCVTEKQKKRIKKRKFFVDKGGLFRYFASCALGCRSIGRTADSGSANQGSSPCSPANKTSSCVPIVEPAQDNGLSRRRQGFKSPWGRQKEIKGLHRKV